MWQTSEFSKTKMETVSARVLKSKYYSIFWELVTKIQIVSNSVQKRCTIFRKITTKIRTIFEFCFFFFNFQISNFYSSSDQTEKNLINFSPGFLEIFAIEKSVRRRWSGKLENFWNPPSKGSPIRYFPKIIIKSLVYLYFIRSLIGRIRIFTTNRNTED